MNNQKKKLSDFLQVALTISNYCVEKESALTKWYPTSGICYIPNIEKATHIQTEIAEQTRKCMEGGGHIVSGVITIAVAVGLTAVSPPVGLSVVGTSLIELGIALTQMTGIVTGLVETLFGIKDTQEAISGQNQVKEAMGEESYKKVKEGVSTFNGVYAVVVGLVEMAVAGSSQKTMNSATDNRKGGLNSTDDIFTQGKNVLDNFDIDSAYVKPKHLSTSGGNGAKFIGDSKDSVEVILRDAIKNGKVNSITDNGLTQQGKQSYRIVIDAGKEIGTKGETLIRIVVSEDGGMLSAFPVK